MTELAIYTSDRGVSENNFKQANLIGRGDVFETLPDGSDWGTEGRVHPDWRIVRFSDLPPGEEAIMMTQQPGVRDGPNANFYLHRRHFNFDLDSLPLRVRQELEAPNIGVIDLPELRWVGVFANVKRMKPDMLDPNEIG